MGFLEKGSEKGSGVKTHGSETLMPQMGKHGSCQVCRLPSELLPVGLIFLCVVASHQPLKRGDWPFPASVLFCFCHKHLSHLQGLWKFESDSDRAGLGVGGRNECAPNKLM